MLNLLSHCFYRPTFRDVVAQFMGFQELTMLLKAHGEHSGARDNI